MADQQFKIPGKCKITAILQNPDGVWEKEIPLNFDDPRAVPQAYKQLLMAEVRDGGLWREIINEASENEHEFIPAVRIRNINIHVEASTIALADANDLLNATRGADAAAALRRAPGAGGPRLVTP